MKKSRILFAAVLALCLLAPSSLAAGKLKVTQENFHVMGTSWVYGYAYAKVENAGDKPIKVNAGVLEIYDGEGNAITSSDYLHAYAEYLKPGEYTYVEMYAELETGDSAPKAEDYMLTLTGKSDNSEEAILLPCEASLELNVKDGWWTYNYMYATITNNLETPLYGISVVLALLDAEGNILYIDDDALYDDRALTPGSSMIIRKDISSSAMEYIQEKGFTPVSVDAIAYAQVTKE